nr:unnamed protein product [Digitaria exilis]
MPGLTAPSDYVEEPPRHPALKINSKEPFNAEPHRSALVTSYITPVEFFYKRNHGPIPKVEDLSRKQENCNEYGPKSKRCWLGHICSWKCSVSSLGGKHVEFVSVDRCKILNRDHGYPLRVVVPGVIGARSVKWLDSINIKEEECQSAICTLEDVDVIKEGKARIAGYALSGGGRGIERVDISVDGGKTWVEARRWTQLRTSNLKRWKIYGT